MVDVPTTPPLRPNRMMQLNFADTCCTGSHMGIGPQIRKLHSRRESLDDPYETSMLNLVKTGQLGGYQWRYNYEAALEKKDDIIRLGDIRTLTYLLLVIQHCLRVPRDPGAWTFVGVAMRLCVELGLHRRKKPNAESTLKSELEKRLFWACYYLDRDLAMALGRPPCISDHDIDAELPLDLDEECEDPSVIKRMRPSTAPASPATSLTCFIHTVRLKRIKSRVRYKLYRVDTIPNDACHEIELALESLNSWKEAIPPESNARDRHSLTHYMLHYHICTRLILQPQFCLLYLSLQTVFLAGLTLVYTMWHAPSSTSVKKLSALSDCSVMLYVTTERWPAIRRYRDAFEAIKRSVLELIADDKHAPRMVVPALTTDDTIWSSLQGLNLDIYENLNRDDLEQMLGDMAGENRHLPPLGELGGEEMEFYYGVENETDNTAETTIS
ncbi:hypothetical protein GQ53DRAFT_826702 [Thozetella sp. PMI_491]|nr:hypothetical protein GQ53DRAFT_826702 [Thozetella sp. PMI_491]